MGLLVLNLRLQESIKARPTDRQQLRCFGQKSIFHQPISYPARSLCASLNTTEPHSPESILPTGCSLPGRLGGKAAVHRRGDWRRRHRGERTVQTERWQRRHPRDVRRGIAYKYKLSCCLLPACTASLHYQHCLICLQRHF